VTGNTVLLFVVCRPSACERLDGSNTLLYGGLLWLIWHSRITSFLRVLTTPYNLSPALWSRQIRVPIFPFNF